MRAMRGLGIALLVVLVLAVGASAEVKTSMITFKSGDETIRGYLAVPEGKGPFPGIIVIQEWWGLNEWIKENAEKLAEKGYVALAPDLYRGKVTDQMSVAAQLRKGMPHDRAMRDLKGAVDKLASLDMVDKERLGSIGWCMGGQYSLQLALADNRIDACVICYGAVVTDADELRDLNAKVLGIFGEDDRGIPAQKVREFEKALKAAGKPAERINIYEGAGHGFMRPNNGPKKNPAHRPDQTDDAWQQIFAFFNKTLKK